MFFRIGAIYFIAAALCGVVCFGELASLASAQQVQRIAAVVNDDVISGHDLDQRIQVAVVSTGLADSPEVRRRVRDQVLRALITERLQTQEATRLKISVTQEELNRAIPIIERQNNIPTGRFEEDLKQKGIPYESVVAQIRAEIAWSKVLRRRILPTVNISAEEIDSAIARAQQVGNVIELQVSEIFLAVDSPAQDEEVRQAALRLADQARQDRNFGVIARQFSQGTTAAVDGDIGWVQPGVLPEEVDNTLAHMNVGDISQPIRTVGGYYIVALRNRRMAGTELTEITLTLKQIALPLAATAAQPEVQAVYDSINSVIQSVQGCENFERAATQVQSAAPPNIGTGPLKVLPPNIRQAVETLPIGEVSQPIRTENAVFLLMVCDRQGGAAGPSREQMRERLTQQKVELQARRLLRDLRRDAVIELR